MRRMFETLPKTEHERCDTLPASERKALDAEVERRRALVDAERHAAMKKAGLLATRAGKPAALAMVETADGPRVLGRLATDRPCRVGSFGAYDLLGRD